MKPNPNRRTGLFAILMGLLGIGTSSCEIWPPFVSMYGTPSADWSVSGKVTDEAGNPIQGLQVVLSNRTDNTEGVIYDQNLWPLDTLSTSAQGTYFIEHNGFPISKLQVDVNDIDGEANGGEFESASVVVSDLKYKGGKGWYEGHVDIEVPDIKLRKK